jgi:DNA polymerase alpha subunit A
VEYLLLHAFHGKKFMVPDKAGMRNKESRLINKRKTNVAMEKDGEDVNGLDNSNEIDIENNDQGKGKKGPSYAGGLVLEPKTGLYDKCVLLLDFNSLYPSIIQVNKFPILKLPFRISIYACLLAHEKIYLFLGGGVGCSAREE